MKQCKILFAIVTLLLLNACQQPNILVQQRILSFGTLIDISIATQRKHQDKANKAIEDIRKLLKTRHKQWHAWEKGELSQLNHKLQSTSRAKTSQDLTHLIQLSKQFYQSSNGLFNPAMGKLIAAWGFHGQPRKDQRLIQRLSQNIPNMNHITLNGDIIISQHKEIQFDFGGIAKGLAIEQIKKILKTNQFAHFLINIGGDLYASGTKNGDTWRIGIQNPYKAEAIGTIDIKRDISLFSSGNYQRYYWSNKQRQHHIIDPRTAEPSRNNSAVTVLHPNPITADVAATSLMIAKQSEWASLSQQLGVKDYLVINENQHVWVSQSLFNKTAFNTDLKVHIIDATTKQ